MGNWKALRNNIRKGNTSISLFDLDKDQREQNDISASNPQIIVRMKEIMNDQHTTSSLERFRLEAIDK